MRQLTEAELEAQLLDESESEAELEAELEAEQLGEAIQPSSWPPAAKQLLDNLCGTLKADDKDHPSLSKLFALCTDPQHASPVTGERQRKTEERKAGRVRKRRQYKPPRDPLAGEGPGRCGQQPDPAAATAALQAFGRRALPRRRTCLQDVDRHAHTSVCAPALPAPLCPLPLFHLRLLLHHHHHLLLLLSPDPPVSPSLSRYPTV
jgi:hypothetical protein